MRKTKSSIIILFDFPENCLLSTLLFSKENTFSKKSLLSIYLYEVLTRCSTRWCGDWCPGSQDLCPSSSIASPRPSSPVNDLLKIKLGIITDSRNLYSFRLRYASASFFIHIFEYEINFHKTFISRSCLIEFIRITISFYEKL